MQNSNMTDYDGRYEGNGEDADNYGDCFSLQALASSLHDTHSDSKSQATRHARCVYVEGLPPTANEQSVATFFSQVMAAIGGNTTGPGDVVLTCLHKS
ncbi:uncharacterized protein LOC111009789 isoform X2 [Momordica charantia]|uniref:Uncharacterized protein LOC111009789 isoform X2 n=1 Tax=Momordica charantia TaxID=3673 RepID=A0A6J1CBV5_MOMCH|nr:uncharacterized protein LOC111009789 isoform X2 [Momordica charantia]